MPVLSFEQVAAVAIKAGFDPGPAVIATAITMPESSMDSDAIQQGVPYSAQGWGLWQITPGDSEPQFGINNALLDPLNNARAALAKYDGAGSFEPWTTFTSGKDVPYIGQAEAAVAAVTHLSGNQLNSLVSAARAGSPAAAAGAPGASNWAVHVKMAATLQGRRNTAQHNVTRAISGIGARMPGIRVSEGSPGSILQRTERI
jgi:hypothetical protein